MNRKITSWLIIWVITSTFTFVCGQIICIPSVRETKEPAWFVNGHFFPRSSNVLARLKKRHIKDLHTEKRDTIIKAITFSGLIFITYKKKIAKPNFH